MSHATSREVTGRADASWRPIEAEPAEISARDEMEFREAMEAYKIRSGRMFPTWSESLEVLRAIGYTKRIRRPIAADRARSTVPVALPGPAEFGWFATVETSCLP